MNADCSSQRACVGSCWWLFALSKLAIRHETLTLFDTARNRPVVVDMQCDGTPSLRRMQGLLHSR